MSRIHYSAIPPIHQGPLDFMALVRPPPPLQPHFLAGVLKASWIRSAEYTVVLEHLGVEVTRLATYCDVGELLGSLKEAIQAATGAATRYKITPESTLTAKLLVNVTDAPFVPAPDDDPKRQVRHWLCLEEGLYHRTEDLGASWLMGSMEHRIEHPLSVIKERIVIAGFEVWSSHSTRQQQTAQEEQLRLLASEQFVLS